MSQSRFGQLAVLIVAVLTVACGDDSEGGLACAPTEAACGSTTPTPRPPVCTACPATTYTRADVEPLGTVVTTADGFRVRGSLSLKTSDHKRITFAGVDVEVRFDTSGRLRSISGKVEIPSPHERIAFGEPVRADVGVFAGSYLNEQRNLGIRLKDDTDYFVFDVQQSINLSIATGETGANATKPIVVRAPSNGRMLMIVDYRDPMYFVYGAQDVIGAAGMGWSLNGRIPFVPEQTVAGLGAFDGKTTRVGTFPVFKVMAVTGQMVDNSHTELHLSQQDPFASTLRAGYQAGFNGELSLDLFLKNVAGLEIPVAAASGGVRGDGSAQGFSGYAFVRGTTRDLSWWPAFIPAKPTLQLDVSGRMESDGRFQIALNGEYGWELPSGGHSMSGVFELTDQAMTLAGSIKDGSVDLNIKGVVTAAATTVSIVPPAVLLQQLSGEVNRQVLPQIAAAQTAWNNLQKATADYQFELSLRGVRTLLPGIVDVAKRALSDGIKNALKDHEGTIYYGAAKSIADNFARPYYAKLDSLKTAAQSADNATTRALLERMLRETADNKIIAFSHTQYVFGLKVWSISLSHRIMSDAQANQLYAAANNVKYIPATSSVMISMQQVYNAIPSRAIFEQVRDDITNGVIQMAKIDELGFVVQHAGQPAFRLYAIIGGKRSELGALSALTVAELAAKLPAVMIDALRSN